MLIYKIVPRSLWTAAAASGSFTGAPVDVADGFIHFSTGAQVRDTARLHFAGQDDLVLVACDADALGTALRWEPSRGGALFPHLFAPLPVSAALSVMDLGLGADNVHTFPADLA